MEPTLTPVLALRYLRELSTDVRAGVVLDASGAHLAGAPGMADAARRLAEACTGARAAEVRTADGSAFVTVSAAHSLVILAGPLALTGLVFHDMAAVMALLTGPDDDSVAPLIGADERRGTVDARRVAVRWAGPGEPLRPISAQDRRFSAVARHGSALWGALDAE